MSTSNKIKMSLAVLCAVAGVSGQLMAQEESETLYQGDMKAGIHLSAEGSNKSQISDAARTGKSIVISSSTGTRTVSPSSTSANTHLVNEGDTLWDICIKYYADPYVWPRIWSYNTNITNPHWIYPGDQIWLVPPMGTTPATDGGEGDDRMQAMSTPQLPDAILSRTRGYVDNAELEKSGVVSGAQKTIMMLSQYDEAYVEFEKNRDVQVGDEFAVYQILKEVDAVDDEGTDPGKLVEILGLVRVTRFDKKNGVARVVVDESILPIERGAIVGPVHRKFEMVSSVTNRKEMTANVVAHLDPGIMYSTHNIVFIDKGKEEGVVVGNRFFATRKRDGYQESINKDDANENFPFEVIGEFRVLETRPHTSTCIVTASTIEMEDGQKVEMVKGY